MRKRSSVDIGRYGYATGRVRALEAHLMDSARLNRVFEARLPEDIGRVLQECGYPAGDPETSLVREQTAVYELMRRIIPDKAFVDALLLFHDCHNLKAILKSLVAWWPRPDESFGSPETGMGSEQQQSARPEPIADKAGLPEPRQPVQFSTVESLMIQPSLIAPAVLFQAVRDRQLELLPAWLDQAALQAVQAYQASYDVAAIDLVLDQTAYCQAQQRAAQLGNAFFSQYLTLRIDLVNLAILLRARFLHQGERYLRQALLPGGTFLAETLLAWFPVSADQLAAALTPTRLGSLAPLVADFGHGGTTGRFSREADHLILRHLDRARRILRGPEIPLAYLIARLLEIKNVRIALTCLRNGLPPAQARELARDSYLTWR